MKKSSIIIGLVIVLAFCAGLFWQSPLTMEMTQEKKSRSVVKKINVTEQIVANNKPTATVVVQFDFNKLQKGE